MRRDAIILSVLLLGSGTVGVLTVLRGQAIDFSDFIFRSEEELLSVRNLLGEPQAWHELSSLSEKMALWRVGSSIESAPPGADCLPLSPGAASGERVRHRFDFAGSHGVSSRVYRVEYLSCKLDDGQYAVERSAAGFRSNFGLRGDPLLVGLAPLAILRLAVNDPGVSSDLVDALRQESIAYCSVRPLDGSDSNGRLFWLIASDGTEEPRVFLEYRVEYDASTGTATFSRQ